MNSDNQLSATGYSFDGNGNPTTYAGTSLVFYPLNTMTAYGSAESNGYTAAGLRARKTNSSGTTFFIYDGDTQDSGLTTSGALTDLDTFGINGLISCQMGSSSVHYLFDPQGSMAQLIISSGTIWGDGMSDAFGSVLGSSSTDPYSGYGSQWGYYTDSETGLSLLGHRFYDPANGRFINRDPISSDGGIDLYAYVKNNAVNSFDPDGHGGGPDVCSSAAYACTMAALVCYGAGRVPVIGQSRCAASAASCAYLSSLCY